MSPPVEQSKALERAVRNMDDIKSVISLLAAGANGTPRCKVAAPTQKWLKFAIFSNEIGL